MFFGSRFFFHASFVLSNTYGLFGSSVISPAETAVGVLGGGFCEVLGAIDFGVVLVLELALAVSLSFFFCSARMVLCILPDLSVIRYDYTLVADVHISPSSMTFFFWGGGGDFGFLVHLLRQCSRNGLFGSCTDLTCRLAFACFTFCFGCWFSEPVFKPLCLLCCCSNFYSVPLV